jgi:GNAT superfamily N-acetyltransferase
LRHNRLVQIRPAGASDYATFVTLFAELGVDDPVLPEARFVAEVAPAMLVAEDGAALGYVYFRCTGELAYVYHLVTARSARRRGVGRALMGAVAERARGAGCTEWCLNVLRGNAAALALYGELGMKIAHESLALDVGRAVIAMLPAMPGVSARSVPKGEDERVERDAGLARGSFARARARGRALFVLEEGGAVVGAAVFDASFPGAFPFRVARPALGPALLRAVASLVPQAEKVHVMVEAQPEVAGALLALGATVRHELFHMRGAL